MRRLLSLIPLAVAATAIAPAAAQAHPGAYYTATPVAAPGDASYVTQSTAWSCGAGVCTAPKAPDRAEFVCQRIAKSVGKLDSFTAGGAALDADALAKCNAKAK